MSIKLNYKLNSKEQREDQIQQYKTQFDAAISADDSNVWQQMAFAYILGCYHSEAPEFYEDDYDDLHADIQAWGRNGAE